MINFNKLDKSLMLQQRTDVSNNDSAADITPPKKKHKRRKRKHKSFKSILRDALRSKKTDEEISQQHRQNIMSSLGGGKFSKVDKI